MSSLDFFYTNFSELKDFIERFNLKDDHYHIYFSASVQIKTATNSNHFPKTRIQISLSGYGSEGVITILEGIDGRDRDLYPQRFHAKYLPFSFENKNCLRIEGDHHNPQIGKYLVRITPN